MIRRPLTVAILALFAICVLVSKSWAGWLDDVIKAEPRNVPGRKAVGNVIGPLHHDHGMAPNEVWKSDRVIDNAMEPGPAALSRCNTKPVPDDCP